MLLPAQTLTLNTLSPPGHDHAKDNIQQLPAYVKCKALDMVRDSSGTRVSQSLKMAALKPVLQLHFCGGGEAKSAKNTRKQVCCANMTGRRVQFKGLSKPEYQNQTNPNPKGSKPIQKSKSTHKAKYREHN